MVTLMMDYYPTQLQKWRRFFPWLHQNVNLKRSELFQYQEGHLESCLVAIVAKANIRKEFLRKESVVDCHWCALGTGLEIWPQSSQTLYFTALNIVDICLFDCATCLLLHNKVESNINFLSVKYRYGPYKGHLWAGWAVQITHWEKGFSNRRPNIYVKNHQCLEFLTLFTATLKISRTCHDAKG